MATIDILTEAERNLLTGIRKLLGDNLTDFLLSGLGESGITHRRTFTAQRISSDGNEITYQFEMVNDSELGLPVGRDPLVLAALLDLLWERQPLDSRVLFKDSHILEKLGWPLDVETQGLTRQSLERYFLVTYCLIDPTVNEGGRLLGRYAGLKRLFVGYETTSVMLPVKRTTNLGLTKVQFLPEFFYDILSERKYFLGIEFQGLREIHQVPC
jgi:hypothetical protein